MQESLKAADKLDAKGIFTTVADARFAKPIDQKLIMDLCLNHEVLITIEEGSIGGFSSHVFQILSERGIFDKGLKNILSGFLFYQKEIVKFINRCKEFENDNGYITQNFFDLQEISEYKFVSGPFVDKIFHLINDYSYRSRVNSFLIINDVNFCYCTING